MTVQEALTLGGKQLRRVKIESYRIDSALLLAKVLNKPRAWLFAHPDVPLSDADGHRYLELINRRSQHTPLVHLTNHREFYGLELYIDERVLTPRVETEQMVEWAIQYAPQNSRLIDIGTGSGALAIAVKKHRPDLEIWATDVSVEALKVARRNAEAHNIDISWIESDLWDSVDGRFATIVTNLPYLQDDADLMPEVQKEPAVALFGGSDGLTLYRRFLKNLPQHLESGGHLFTECDPWQHEPLAKEAASVGLKPIEQGYFILGFQRD